MAWHNFPLSVRHSLDEVSGRINGQREAVTSVAKAIRRTRAGLHDPKRLSGSFIFAGPSGVGKTELSKALSYCQILWIGVSRGLLITS